MKYQQTLKTSNHVAALFLCISFLIGVRAQTVSLQLQNTYSSGEATMTPFFVVADINNDRYVDVIAVNSGINNWEVTKAHINGDKAVHKNFEKIAAISHALRGALGTRRHRRRPSVVVLDEVQRLRELDAGDAGYARQPVIGERREFRGHVF